MKTSEGTYTTFDAPGAVNGTVPSAVASPSGSIVGNYFDANFQSHGFLRNPDGTITTFDPAGSIYTSAAGINAAGTIIGFWVEDVTFVNHGFVRSSDGTVTTFDVGPLQTYPRSINAAGIATGNYGANGGLHGFIRDMNGTVTTFDPPGSATSFAFTFANGINPAGVITGWYVDPSFLGHGFIRIPH